jgi:hypothetical protein
LAAKACAFALVAVLFVRALSAADLRSAGSALREAGPLAAIVLVPAALALALESVAWSRLFARLGDVPRGLLRVRVAMESIAIAMPAGGLFADAAGAYLLARDSAVSKTVAASAAKRWLIVRAHGLYVLLAALVGHAALARSGLVAIVVAAGVALVGGSFVVERASARVSVGARAAAIFSRMRASSLFGWMCGDEDAAPSLCRVDDELGALSGAPHVRATALLVATWILESASSWLALSVLGARVSFADVLLVDAALSVLRSVVVFAPAGLGVQDLGYLTLFDVIGLHGVGPAFLVLKRTKDLAVFVVGALLLVSLGQRTKIS